MLAAKGKPTTMKLTVEQHAEIAKHLHAADHHLLKALEIMKARIPVDIVNEIENVRDALGAATASRITEGSILERCQDVLLSEWPGSGLETYHGSYGECVTLALDAPYRPPEEKD
jgi:hypothetical protein